MSFFVTAGPDHFRQKYSTTVYVAMLSDQPAAADDFWRLDSDKQHSHQDGCHVEENELSEWYFCREEGEDLETVGRHDLLQAHRDEAGGGSLNDGGAVAAAKIILIVLSEKSDFWVEEFPKKVISALIASMKHLKMPFQLTKIHLKDRCWRCLWW